MASDLLSMLIVDPNGEQHERDSVYVHETSPDIAPVGGAASMSVSQPLTSFDIVAVKAVCAGDEVLVKLIVNGDLALVAPAVCEFTDIPPGGIMMQTYRLLDAAKEPEFNH